jgi:hypothetical protein
VYHTRVIIISGPPTLWAVSQTIFVLHTTSISAIMRCFGSMVRLHSHGSGLEGGFTLNSLLPSLHVSKSLSQINPDGAVETLSTADNCVARSLG